MRIRSIKPEFWDSESLGRICRESRLLFIGLWSLADDAGRLRASSRFLASRLFPFDTDAIKLIPRWIRELEQEGCVRLYCVEGNHYLDIPKWLNHQKIDHPSPSKLPCFGEGSRDFERTREDSREDQGGEGSGEEQGVEGTPKGVASLADDSFIQELRVMYSWLDMDVELTRMRAWLMTPKGRGRKLTRRFMVNWLNRQDKPIEGQSSVRPVRYARRSDCQRMPATFTPPEGKEHEYAKVS